MAINYTQAYAVANDLPFQNRVQESLTAACISITNEATNTANHAQRNTLARNILANPGNYVAAFANGVMVQSAMLNHAGLTTSSTTVQIETAILDSEIDTQVAAIFSSYFPQ